MDKQQAVQLIGHIATAYPTFEPTPERVELWVKKMAGIGYEKATNRLDQYIEMNRFAPTIADILNPDGKNDNPKLINGHPF